jgi:sorting nexin-25
MEHIANHEKDDWINGEKTEDIVAYLDRLYTAKRKVEKRIAVLGGVDDSVSHVAHVSRRLSHRNVPI